LTFTLPGDTSDTTSTLIFSNDEAETFSSAPRAVSLENDDEVFETDDESDVVVESLDSASTTCSLRGLMFNLQLECSAQLHGSMCKILADISDRLLSPLVPVITEGCIERCASYHQRLLSELSDEPIPFIQALSLAFGCRFVIIQCDALAQQSKISHVTVVDADIVADMQWSTELNWDFVASSSFHSVILASSRKAWLDFTGVDGEAHVGNVWLLGSNDRSHLLSFEEKRLQQLLVSFGFLEPCGSKFVQLHQIQEDTFAGLSSSIPASLAFHQLNQKPLDGLSGSSKDEVRHIEEVYNHLRIKGLFRITYDDESGDFSVQAIFNDAAQRAYTLKKCQSYTLAGLACKLWQTYDSQWSDFMAKGMPMYNSPLLLELNRVSKSQIHEFTSSAVIEKRKNFYCCDSRRGHVMFVNSNERVLMSFALVFLGDMWKTTVARKLPENVRKHMESILVVQFCDRNKVYSCVCRDKKEKHIQALNKFSLYAKVWGRFGESWRLAVETKQTTKRSFDSSGLAPPIPEDERRLMTKNLKIFPHSRSKSHYALRVQGHQRCVAKSLGGILELAWKEMGYDWDDAAKKEIPSLHHWASSQKMRKSIVRTSDHRGILREVLSISTHREETAYFE
jgi:hypothetical protein